MPMTSAATNQPSPFISVYGIVIPPRGLWFRTPACPSWIARSREIQLPGHEQVLDDVNDTVAGAEVGIDDRDALDQDRRAVNVHPEHVAVDERDRLGGHVCGRVEPVGHMMTEQQ